MSSAVSQWPSYYPANTPPDEAKPTSGVSFRLVENNPPIKADFRSTYEETPARTYKSDDEFICACGTSQFKKLKDIKKKRKLFPKLRNKMIARGTLEATLGVMLDTYRPSHHTVWYRVFAQPQNNFTVMEDV